MPNSVRKCYLAVDSRLLSTNFSFSKLIERNGTEVITYIFFQYSLNQFRCAYRNSQYCFRSKKLSFRNSRIDWKARKNFTLFNWISIYRYLAVAYDIEAMWCEELTNLLRHIWTIRLFLQANYNNVDFIYFSFSDNLLRKFFVQYKINQKNGSKVFK